MTSSVSIVGEKAEPCRYCFLSRRSSRAALGLNIPYFVLVSDDSRPLMLAFSYTLLGIPFSVTALITVWVSVVCRNLARRLFMVSTVAKTQFTALVISGVLWHLSAVTMLSGMLFPVENMPVALRRFSCTVPTRWYRGPCGHS